MARLHQPTAAKNAERVMMKIVSVITGYDGTKEADQVVGGATRNRARRRCWTATAAPSTAPITGIRTGDLCLDITNDVVYRRVQVASGSASWAVVADNS